MINQSNKNKIILDLCGGTGSWSKPYREAGYTVLNITLPNYDITQFEEKNGFLTFKSQNLYAPNITVEAKSVYGILAAPPCTEFSLAKTSVPRDLQLGLKTVAACLQVIWACQIDVKSHLKFWALENPVGLLSRFLGKPAYKCNYWQYGHHESKTECLWGLFKEPTPTVKIKPDFEMVGINTRTCKSWGSPKCPEEYKELGLKRSDIRAITPPCFAQAFYKANK